MSKSKTVRGAVLEIGRMNDNEFSEKFKSAVSPKELKSLLNQRKDLCRVIGAWSEQDVATFANTGEIPTVKLSDKDLELLQGGGIIITLWKVVVFGFEIAIKTIAK